MKNWIKIKKLLMGLLAAVVLSCHDHAMHTGHKDTASSPAQDTGAMADMPGMEMAPIDHSDMLVLSEREKMLAGIKTDSVQMEDFQESISALGMVAIDESTVTVISAKTDGRIDHLYQRNPGDEIHPGVALYDLYSETLLAEEQDLIGFVENGAQQNLIDAARTKLKLHGLNNDQVAAIEKEKAASARITIYSTADGFISSLPIREGQYVQTGEVLFEIASLEAVRINTQIYTEEISRFNTASVYEVVTDANPSRIYTASKILENPALETNSKIMMMRLRVVNTGHLLRPGMMVNVRVKTNPEKCLAVPKTALLMENKMPFVWVLETHGMFNRRMVETGKENETSTGITTGLQRGEIIVVAGTYLLNSEYILRKGSNQMSGMKM